MDFDNNRPIYLQLMDEWRRQIVRSHWPPGSRMDSVRDLAERYGVNPNTVQRALAELERAGLAQSRRTTGRFITDDIEQIARLRDDMAVELLDRFTNEASELGLDLEQLIDRLKARLRNNDKEA